MGKGSKPSPSGQVVADENGSKAPLRAYNRKTVVITLPSDLTVFDIDYLSVWCEDFFADFGHVRIEKASLNVPPSLKMLGVKPQVSGAPCARGHGAGSRSGVTRAGATEGRGQS